jgi:hypothetical protein
LPRQPKPCIAAVKSICRGSPTGQPSSPRYPAYRISWSFQIRANGWPGCAGAKTLITGRIAPRCCPPLAACRWCTSSAKISSAVRARRRSRTTRLRQYNRPMHRAALRQAIFAP